MHRMKPGIQNFPQNGEKFSTPPTPLPPSRPPRPHRGGWGLDLQCSAPHGGMSVWLSRPKCTHIPSVVGVAGTRGTPRPESFTWVSVSSHDFPRFPCDPNTLPETHRPCQPADAEEQQTGLPAAHSSALVPGEPFPVSKHCYCTLPHHFAHFSAGCLRDFAFRAMQVRYTWMSCVVFFFVVNASTKYRIGGYSHLLQKDITRLNNFFLKCFDFSFKITQPYRTKKYTNLLQKENTRADGCSVYELHFSHGTPCSRTYRPRQPPNCPPKKAFKRPRCAISLRDGGFCAKFVLFRGSQPLLPHLCPVSVLVGAYMGYIRKALEKGFPEMYGLGGGVRNNIFCTIGRYL